MNEFLSIGKILIISGVLMLVIGVSLTIWDKITLLGKLPGDIMLKGKNFTIYFPIVTSILLSAIISLVLYIIRK